MGSKEYWEKREAEALKHRITEEEAYDKELEKIYQNMLDNCQKEVDAFFGKYAKQEGITLAEAKKRVSELDIKAYERKAKRYVKDKNFSKEANEEMRLYNLTMKVNRLEMLKANIGLELISGHDELQKFMGGILQGRTEDELKRQAGILGKTIRNNAKLANSIVNASFHNATFSDRIWMYQDILKDDLDGLLQRGLIGGKSSRALAKDLKDRFGVRRSDAERLMRTELARVQTEAQKKSFEENGFKFYQFIHNHNGTRVGNDTCGDCVRLATTDNGHGEGVYKVADMMPGTNAPPMHPHCRCSTAAYEDSDEYEAWLDYLDKGGTTEEWEGHGKGR
jgi:SPP1 gp7 family putative phage head morphogenesis protein